MKLYDVIVSENNRSFDLPNEPIVPPHLKKTPREQRSFKRHIIVYGIFFAFIALIYALGVIYAHATVTIYERQIPFTIDQTSIDLVHETSSDTERLMYQAMVINDTLTRDVFGSEVTVSNTKAKGQVVFFNEYSTSTQTIGAGTTLLSTDAKKYLLQEKVTIPGYTLTKGTKTKQPGASKPVTVLAFAAGSDYNTSGTSFSVAAYTGTKKTQLYARSSSAISGGQSGGIHTVSASEKEATITSLKTQLAERLKRQTRPQIPAGFITYPELQLFSVDENSLILEGQDVKFPASIAGSMVTYLIPSDPFEQAIARVALGERTFPKVAIPGITDLTVSPESSLPVSEKTFPETINLSVSGQGTIIAKVDIDTIKNSLIGMKRKNFTPTLSKVQEIDHASYSVFPFWAPYFPSKIDRIKIIIK